MAKRNALVVLTVLVIVSSLGTDDVVRQVRAQQGLTSSHYNVTCPSVEKIVRSTMTNHFKQDPSIAAHILRLQFHDCAATGCDASVLLAGPQSEQEATPNLTLLGYEIIDEIKAQLEVTCTGVVSCSDILTIAARDAVFLSGGPSFSVPLGRFDSTFNAGINVNLPSADDTVDQNVAFFQNLGLSAADFVFLLGAHTLGVAHCTSFSNRLYNFQNTGAPDPSIEPSFLATLQAVCPAANPNADSFVTLDQQSEFAFDNHVYSGLTKGQGLLRIDQELFTTNSTSSTVTQLSRNQTFFFQSFAVSLVKLGLVGVRNSTSGNIRANCSVVGTSPAPSPATAPAPAPGATPSPSPVTSPAPAPVTPAPSPRVAIGPSPAASPGIPGGDSPITAPSESQSNSPAESPEIQFGAPGGSPAESPTDSQTELPAPAPTAGG